MVVSLLIEAFVQQCASCQVNKSSYLERAGRLHLLVLATRQRRATIFKLTQNLVVHLAT